VSRGRKKARPAPASRTSTRVPMKPLLGGLVLLAVAAVVVAAVYLLPASPLVRASRPNVLLVTIDTLRWDHVGCYGAKLATTPVLDRLAARGVRFEFAIMHVPLTAPSHASILSGVTPPVHGVRDNGDFALPPGTPTLAKSFKSAGYETAGFVSGFPLDRRFGFAAGFDSYDDRLPGAAASEMPGAAASERRADATTDRVLAWLEGHRPASPPWFVWVHYFDPHAAYDPPAEWRARFSEHPYDGEIAFVDHEIGRLLDGVARIGHASDTVTLVTADHGESLGDHGEETHGVFIYDATLRVPWILAGPGVPEKRVSQVIARGIDVMPTLLDLARVAPPQAMEGRSLVEALHGSALPDEPAYLESLLSARHFGWAELHGIRTARWKYIAAPSPELYDLVADSSEAHDLHGHRPVQIDALSRELGAMLKSSGPGSAERPPDPEAARRLAALGYVGRSVRGQAPDARRDPKSSVGLINRLEHAIAETHVNPARGIEQLRGILAEDPGISIARAQLAAALSSNGDPRGAIDQVEHLRAGGAADADDLLVLAESLRVLGRTREAKAAREEAARLDPASPEPPLTEARAAMGAGDTARATAAYQRALHLAPEHPEALAGLGEIALRGGDVTAAGAYFQRALAQDPASVTARLRLGMIRGREGRLDEAIALLRQVVEQAPGNGEALAGLAAALARSGAPAAAVPYFERAIAAGPRTPAVLNGLAFARLETGDRGGALAAMRASLAIDPNQPRIAGVMRELRSGRPTGDRR
jgi:choline-sulfatase